MKIDKKKIVIANYFKKDCTIDTTIREAYRMGFERALQKTKPTWIPCSERLPDFCEVVFASIKYNTFEDVRLARRVMTTDRKEVWGCEGGDDWEPDYVVAWMQLPKPYKGSMEET